MLRCSNSFILAVSLTHFFLNECKSTHTVCYFTSDWTRWKTAPGEDKMCNYLNAYGNRKTFWNGNKIQNSSAGRRRTLVSSH